jgi:hypothetical protein
MAVLGIETKGDQDSQNYQSKNQLSFVQAISVADAGVIVWSRSWQASARLGTP